MSILTERLELVPATAQLTRAALGRTAELASLLSAEIPRTWPPDFLDRPALEFTLARLAEGPEDGPWWLHFFVRRASGSDPATLIGSGGYKGPPSEDGTVEVGYGIVRNHRRQGYATEATNALVSHAFLVPEVRRVIAETLPDLVPSIGVLGKCGFCLADERSEPGVLRFELTRAAFASSARHRRRA